MEITAIVMMNISIILLWGTLAWSAWNLRYRTMPTLDPEIAAMIDDIEAAEAKQRLEE